MYKHKQKATQRKILLTKLQTNQDIWQIFILKILKLFFKSGVSKVIQPWAALLTCDGSAGHRHADKTLNLVKYTAQRINNWR